MERELSKAGRMFLLLIAVVAWVALVVQYFVLFDKPGLRGTGFVWITLRFLNFFTILTNLLVAVSSTVPLLAPQSTPGSFFSRTSVRSAIALYITLVGIVFNIVLRATDIREGFADKLANELTHLVVPSLYLLFWLFFVPKGGLNWKDPLYWLIYPLIYVIWVFIYGGFTSLYPYPFLQVGELGYVKVLINSLVLIAVFLVAGLAFVGIDRLAFARELRE